MASRRAAKPGATTPAGTLRELEALARKVGIPVRYEAMRVGLPRDDRRVTGRGGLVRVRGEAFIVCDAALPAIDKVFVLAEALAALDVEYLHLPQLLRARIRHRPAPAEPAAAAAPAAASLGEEHAGLAGGDADGAGRGGTLHELRERSGR